MAPGRLRDTGPLAPAVPPPHPPEVLELAASLKKENPSRSAAQIRRIIAAQLGWAPDERTIQRMIVREGLTALQAPSSPAVSAGSRPTDPTSSGWAMHCTAR